MTNEMAKTKKTARTTLPAGVGKVLKRLHYPGVYAGTLENSVIHRTGYHAGRSSMILLDRSRPS